MTNGIDDEAVDAHACLPELIDHRITRCGNCDTCRAAETEDGS